MLNTAQYTVQIQQQTNGILQFWGLSELAYSIHFWANDFFFGAYCVRFAQNFRYCYGNAPQIFTETQLNDLESSSPNGGVNVHTIGHYSHPSHKNYRAICTKFYNRTLSGHFYHRSRAAICRTALGLSVLEGCLFCRSFRPVR